MGKLVYTAIASLDGYVEDEDGSFDWSQPDEAVVHFINELERPLGTYLYGRRMFETMLYWETADISPDQSAALNAFTAIWRAADKIVYSRTLQSVSTARTRLEREFDAGAIEQLKRNADNDLSVAGAGLAAQAITFGLVDELSVFVLPVILGGGKSWLPSDARVNLELLDTRRFQNGTVYLRYRPHS